VGFAIPETLITNDVTIIIEFLERHENVIYKPFRVPVWYKNNETNLAVTMTTKITLEDIRRNADSLRFAPGIFQERIAKQRELRITAFGKHCLSATISTPDGNVDDWRADLVKSTVKATDIPHAIERMINKYMSDTGLRFGCFDFIIDTEGKFVFLEVNQMGQFLWVENADPSIPLLDSFAKFLCEIGGMRFDDRVKRLELASFFKSSEFIKFQENMDGDSLMRNLDSAMLEP